MPINQQESFLSPTMWTSPTLYLLQCCTGSKNPSEQGVFGQLQQPLGEGGFMTSSHHCPSSTSAFRLLALCLAAAPASGTLPFPAPKVSQHCQAGTGPLTSILLSALLIRHSEVLDPLQHQERHQQHVREPAPTRMNEVLAINSSPQPPGAEEKSSPDLNFPPAEKMWGPWRGRTGSGWQQHKGELLHQVCAQRLQR